MVQSKLTLLALASTTLAGVVRREEPEVDHLNPEDFPFPLPPDWVTSTHRYFEGTGPSPIAFVQAHSDHSREPHSTYLPSGLPSHFPQPTEEASPPFVTSFPGAGEFAHTKDSAKPISFNPVISHPVPPGASYEGPPLTFSKSVRPEEPQPNTPPPAFQASSSHPHIQYSYAETPYSPSTKLPSFSDGHPRPSDPASVKPTEPWDGLDAVKPTSFPETPSWISYLPLPSKPTPGPEVSENHLTAPSALPEAYQGPPPLPFDSLPGEVSEPHGSYPAGPRHTPPPDESEQEPHPSPFDFTSGKPPGPESSSPAAAHQPPPPHGSYQERPPFTFSPGGPHEEISPPAESHQTAPPPESYQGPPPTFTVPEEPSQLKGSPPAGPHQLPPPPSEPYQESSPLPFDSTPGELPKPDSSSPESYDFPPPSAQPSSHPGDADHPTGPIIPHGGPSPHYGAVPPISCIQSSLGEAPVDTNDPYPMGHDEQHPHPEEIYLPPFTPPFENDKEPHTHELAPPQAVPTLEQPSVTHTDAYVPHFSKPEPTVAEAPSVSHAAVPPTMPPNYTEVHSEPAISSPTSDKPQLEGTTGEHHIYGSSPSAHPIEASGVAEGPSATRAAPEPSKTGVPKAGESAVHYSSSAPASAVPITALLGAFSTLVFFFLR